MTPGWWLRTTTCTTLSRSGGAGGSRAGCRNWAFPARPSSLFASLAISAGQIPDTRIRVSWYRPALVWELRVEGEGDTKQLTASLYSPVFARCRRAALYQNLYRY